MAHAIKTRDESAKTQPSRRDLIPLLLVLLGILVMCYPVIGTYYKNVQQSHVADAYRQSVTSNPEDYTPLLDEARRYNQENTGAPILDPWLARVSKDNRPYQDYLEQLNPTGNPAEPIAALAIPSIESVLPVYHGTDPSTLEHGVGHLYGSALPVGGDGTHTVLTGHSGLTNATLFDHLDKVKVGDKVFLTVFGEQLAYEVDAIDVVLPTEISSLQPEDGKDLLTLITCTPYGINSHRLLVRAHRIPLDPQEADEAFQSQSNWQWWMTLVVAIILIALLLLALRRRKNDKKTGAHRAGRRP
ncbi:class C sortase [Corynebacterium glucuronolyticum]|uniref:class C sortase n=1 Tax=Corynebacterium glucuronolyticum TaxID=39791 RepID=UPI0002F76F4C|nr:class C sortase [Corynebacterium glucuronolyticum]QRO81885.1 class C sortase [Corynebacterium glucuronolyticum]